MVRSAENLYSERTWCDGPVPVPVRPGRDGPHQTADADGAPTDRPGQDLAERGGQRGPGSPVPAGWRQAMNRSGRTGTAPPLAICRWRSQVQRGSHRSPSR